MIPGSIDLNLLSSGKYEIGKSLRFRASNSARLTRTPASAGNRRTWTWSAWVKRGLQSSAQTLFEANAGTDFFRFDSSNRLELYFNNANTLLTTPVYRDSSSWYHIVLAVDTTQATSSNRIKVYVNGQQITAFSFTSYPALNTDGAFNNTVAHTIGAQNTTNYFDGYLADVNLVDGLALTPSSFGKTDSSTGVWVPSKFYGNYGTTGFFLPFKDATSTTTIGYDYSGKNNNFTTSGISVTSGTTFDQMLDTPNLNYAVMNPIDTTSTTFSNANLSLSVPFATDSLAKGAFLLSSGKWYWEITITGGGLGAVGILVHGTSETYYPGYTSANGISYNFGGTVYRTGIVIQTYNSFTTNDVIGIALDIDNGKVFFAKNGTWQGSADPAAGTNPTANTGITNNVWAPCSGNNAGTAATHTYNFGQRAFAYTAPSGFSALNSSNLPTPSILKPNTYMDTVAYTGGSDTYWSSISAGDHYAIAIKTDGTLWAWGTNDDNQLGLGDTLRRSSPTIINSSSWSKISAGTFHSLAIRSDGTLWAWGSNGFGMLGLGDTTTRTSPVQVGSSSWSQIGAGSTHSLGIRSDNTLWAWGLNNAGQLGLGDTTNRSSPVQVGTSSWTQVDGGYSYTVAIRSDGTMWAWGLNNTGQLGLGNTTNRSSPDQVGTSSWVAISAGQVHSAAIRLGNSLFTWGDNTNGRLGDSTITSKSSPVLIGSSSWTAVDVSSFSSAIRLGGSLFTWGENSSGELGLNDTTNRSSPTLVGTSSWTAVRVGTYLLAIRNDSNIFTSGLNTFGQLGDSSVTSKSSPVSVGSKTITTLFAPNLVWIKDRANAVDHALYDSVRGAGLRLETNNTDAETAADILLQSFSNQGAVVRASADQVNIEGRSYIAWNWLESATSGLDIVTYAGNNTSNRNVSHSLGVAPKFAIIKSRSASNWWTWHQSLTGNTYFVNLNSTSGQTLTNTPWGTGNWSSSQFMVTNNATENANATSTNYVAYLWSEVAGFSRFSSYTGNGSTDGPFVWCGFRPDFVITKRVDSTGNWMIMDAIRPGYNLTDYVINSESSGAENTVGGLNRIDILSNGFKVRDSSAVNNANGGTYIFAAFAEAPFKYARAR